MNARETVRRILVKVRESLMLRSIAAICSHACRKTADIAGPILRKIGARLPKEDKAGLYVTVIFHLAVIIVLLAGSISSAITGESSYLLDFSRQEAIEKQMQEDAFREEISRRLDRLLSEGDVDLPAEQDGQIRNIAVDASSSLEDDRNTDAEKLYADAARLQEDLSGYRQDVALEDMRDEVVDLAEVQDMEEDHARKTYKGPSVVSYSLDGRKASTLKIPAYRCMGGGEVTVIITVDNSGRVTNAKVMDDISSQDECLRNYAVRAARLSRFSADPKAPLRQTGEIVYRFLAQGS